MDLYVDGKTVDVAGGATASVQSVLEGLTEFLRDQGRAMVAIEFDGRNMNVQDLADHLADAASIAEVRVTTASISDLVNASLNDVREALKSLPDACRQLAVVFQGSAPQDGFEPFGKVADIWGDIKDRETRVISILGESLDSLELDGKTFAALHDSLNEYLQEAVTAMKNNDYVLLGDLLEYELAPRAEQETAIVDLLQASVHERFSKA